MRTLATLEWISGENPETPSTKLIAINDENGPLVTTGSFYADDEASAPCWHFENGKEVPARCLDGLAWASLPSFDGTPSQINTEPVNSFGDAVIAMTAGRRVGRCCWQLGSSIWLMPAVEIKQEKCQDKHLKALAEKRGGFVRAEAVIRHATQTGFVTTGWTPTVEDMLATDWVVLD